MRKTPPARFNLSTSDSCHAVEMPTATVESLRNLINERLSAAAQEILGVFEQTLSVYEEEIDRQRRLLDVVLRPEIKLHRTKLPQQHVCKEEEEVLLHQQLFNQERSSSLDQQEPEPPHIKKEQEELCASQEGQQLVLKQEDDLFKSSPMHMRSDYSKDLTLILDSDQNQRAAENRPPDNIIAKRARSESQSESPGGPEPNTEHQLVSHASHVADDKDHKSGNHRNATKPKKKHKKTSKSKRNIKPNLKKEQKGHRHTAYSRVNTVLATYSQSKPSEKSFKCNSCSKDFDLYTKLKVHMKTHTAEKTFSCTVCGKGFSFNRYLKQHMITHSGEKPYSCNICWKSFRRFEHLQIHIRSHTGERPYSCVYCDRAFSTSSALTKHVRLHSDEEPYNCSIWGEL